MVDPNLAGWSYEGSNYSKSSSQRRRNITAQRQVAHRLCDHCASMYRGDTRPLHKKATLLLVIQQVGKSPVVRLDLLQVSFQSPIHLSEVYICVRG